MIRLQRVTCTLALLLLLAGCAAPQPGTLIAQKDACDLANHEKRVALEGYPQLTSMTFVDDDFSVDLYEGQNGKGEAVSVYLTIGTGANQAEDLPDDYSDADLKIHTKDNQVVSTDTRIRVHGELYVNDNGDSIVCFVSPVDLIELAPT